jgi:hypothetical protein
MRARSPNEKKRQRDDSQNHEGRCADRRQMAPADRAQGGNGRAETSAAMAMMIFDDDDLEAL